MTQLRFHVSGKPVPSAARDAEIKKASCTPPAAMRIVAGSAARAAEEAKRLENSGKTSAGFSLRATNGRVFRNTPLASSRQGSSVEEQGVPWFHASDEERRTPSHDVSLPAAADRGTAELSVPGPLHAAAVRVQSLFRKLTSISGKSV